VSETLAGPGVSHFFHRRQKTENKTFMKITVKLFASLRKDRFAIEKREYNPGQSVRDVLAGLDITEGEAAILFINSRHADPATILNEGDTLAVFPPVGGG
jgi:sulfur-carrier protein